MRESRDKNPLVEGVNLGDEVRFRISPDVITATPSDHVTSTSALKLHSSAPNGSIKASKLQPIVNQQGLVELSLSRRGLVVLPGDVLTLLRLEVLILNNNRLQVLPAEIGRLHKLRQLDVSKNNLLILPDTLLNLIHLVELNLSWNKLISLPHPLSQLKKLRVLRLGHNNFEVMPSALGELTSLRQLDISHNRLWHLPESCAALRHLNNVSLAGNIFDQLPVSLCEAEGIETLELQGNRLLNLPPHITKLRQLKVLNISHNKLEAVPPPVTGLAQLHTFNVSHNYLRSIPGELARLPNLKDLYARSNNITCLPNDLGNVQLLDVARNHLSNFSVAHMRQLRHLDCGHNVLENLPLGVYVLPHLEVLKLNSNRISYVSQDIVLLRKLRILDLSHNCLTSLPNVIEEMQQLEAFNVRGNKLGKRPLVKTNKDTGGGIGDDGELQSQPYSFQRPYPSMYKKNQGLKATKGKWQKAHHKTPPVAPHSRPNSPGRWNPRGSVKARERPPLDYRPRSGSLSTLMVVSRPQKFSKSADDQVTNKRQVTQPSQVSIQQTNPIAEISYPQCNTAPGTYHQYPSTTAPQEKG